MGHRISQAVIDYAETDNANLLWDGSIPKPNACVWNGTKPINPIAGYWKTFILKSGSQIQPLKPEICGSAADLLDVKQTYEISKHRTREQINAIHYWGDKSPPVIWNRILNEHIQKSNMSLFGAAYASAYLNVGMYDAFVTCWNAKYTYWTARPFQRIENLTTEIPTPNFPGYPSGHSVISTVAGMVLSELFPDKRDYFKSQSVEAGLSRLWAGIHFKQDVNNGIELGNEIGAKVTENMHGPPHGFIVISK